jgi:hypothetical protein
MRPGDLSVNADLAVLEVRHWPSSRWTIALLVFGQLSKCFRIILIGCAVRSSGFGYDTPIQFRFSGLLCRRRLGVLDTP